MLAPIKASSAWVAVALLCICSLGSAAADEEVAAHGTRRDEDQRAVKPAALNLVNREFSGKSEKQDFSEALASALRQMDEEVRKVAKVPCSHVSWRVVEIGGESGTPAGLKTLRVKLVASFEAGNAKDAGGADELHGTWTFEHGPLGEFDRLEVKKDGTFTLEHRDVALGTTTTFGEWVHGNAGLTLHPARQEHNGQPVQDFPKAAETLRPIRRDEGLVLERGGRELRRLNSRQ